MKAKLAATKNTTKKWKSVLSWNEDDVNAWLTSIGMTQYIPNFREQHIYGDVLLDLNPHHLVQLKIVDPSHQAVLRREIDVLRLGPDDCQQ